MDDSFIPFISSNPWFTVATLAAIAYILKEARADYKEHQKKKDARVDRVSQTMSKATTSINKLTWQIEGLDKTLTEMKVDVTKNSKDLNALHSKIRMVESDIKDLKDK